MEKNPEEFQRRKKMFSQFDPNGNGFLSLAEVDKGIRDILAIDALFDCKPAIMRAFQAAKQCAKSKSKYGDDYIEFREFRFFLVKLRQYFEIWQMFAAVDSSSDRRVSLDEFKEALPKLEAWGCTVEDADAEFKKIDTSGGGMVLFDEFAAWAIMKGLDLEDDDD
uniref:EF-hand domain-containing protein n=1 Tax=Chromera velia CCMP2878 TaxID=1169474 RepID=A0A0G4HUU7_9ALVE|eukprot:Cvel_32042.t1-p1 / transcript=Cvel_32042.t1 / gene=Cvel_32042 / organism=Chromera_velia_CCMP2878 / gene_product=Flagellar calcium-binding protein TB-24, putative / transcript_product=Flagellar calcium-binding protein TB-24, putative / location=Cvel_scaffold4891:2347-4438(+) / protein_length=164 / sequence_SO=supercontig / SO=protein_coding / is_pseudo=false